MEVHLKAAKTHARGLGHLEAHGAVSPSNPHAPEPQPPAEPPQALSLTDAMSLVGDAASLGAAGESIAGDTRDPSSRHATVLYVGDHLHGDVVAAVVECGWAAVAVVEELEAWRPARGEVVHLPPPRTPGWVAREPPPSFPSPQDAVWGDWWVGGGGGGDSWWGSLVHRYSVAAVTDVELWIAGEMGV